jgi:Asp-tRNA(Asn)/Glu-tRNA(Gln) amidotransferase A subunit family amidase
LQIIGQIGHDHTVLQLALAYEQCRTKANNSPL